jgi:hypothetical protein
LNISRWYREKSYNFSICPLKSLWNNITIIRHIYCFVRVVCFFFQIQLYYFVSMLV